MSPDNAQGFVIGCMAASGAIAAGNVIAADGHFTFRQGVGFVFTTLGLATVGMFAPRLAAGFSALILTSAVFVYGQPLLDAITTTTTPANAPAPGSTPTTAPTTQKA
jgi:hypothetical protein